MAILVDGPCPPCVYCGEEADYVCDECNKPICVECKAELDDPDCPAEFCLDCVAPHEPLE